MGFCKSRYFMLVICFLQFIAVIQRQVFDFLGYLYIPILLNFFHIIFIIFGSFGAFQYRSKYIITYVLWNLVWLGWNVFLICLYLDVGILEHKVNIILKLDVESNSWWEDSGPGCKRTSEDPNDTRHSNGCFVQYEHIEIFQAVLQTTFSVFGIISGLCLSKVFLEEDDSFNYMGGGNDPQHTPIQPMYVDIDTCHSTSSSCPFIRITNDGDTLPTERKSDDQDAVTVGKVSATSGGDVLLLGDKYLLYDSHSGGRNRHTAKLIDDHYKNVSKSYMSFFKNDAMNTS